MQTKLLDAYKKRKKMICQHQAAAEHIYYIRFGSLQIELFVVAHNLSSIKVLTIYPYGVCHSVVQIVEEALCSFGYNCT